MTTRLPNFLRRNKPKATITGGDPKSTTLSEPRDGLIPFSSLPAISSPCLHCALTSFPMPDQRTLRGISAASLLPAFILCIIAGAVTGHVVPAVGIVPHFFSSALGIAILISFRQQKQQPKWIRVSQAAPRSGDDEAHIDADADSLSDDDEPRLQHSFLVFLADIVLATALIVVLAVTWTEWHHRWFSGLGDHIMLLTYATVPLILNASIHIILALQEFVQGTGLSRVNFRRVFQRMCLLPQDCPHCGNDLHADGAEAPLLAAAPPSWFRGMGGSAGRIKLPVSGVTGVVGWSAPPWMGRRVSEVVGEGQETGIEERVRDDGGVGGEDGGVEGKGKGVAGEVEGEGV